ncbi:multidrug efflux pump-associated protein, AcrZ family [Rouxiella silvae]|uniref:Multidrug efflux pump accessory protein AcrZ n=1 Tax=Rouxiella silvae TaxID=1646373 RepID=A0AA40WZH9_9GAMM|nr:MULTISPECIES: AcrZ family multidrug efflux pump-associated protein [Rouxiella]KAB7897879.1 multidrug efflux pump-associated protein, AcrZ family [Rouxiella sp. S1S-2]MBF6635449.1 multidrug efflux pump-associated protein, AcrZ family [Rouxiella silvae]ORJ21040.1 multidrug efflux pump-associated protein, AcrZ family [Rouxiella silvae]
MLELLESLLFAVIMVPIFIAVVLGLIYGMGELFNVISKVGHPKESRNEPRA